MCLLDDPLELGEKSHELYQVKRTFFSVWLYSSLPGIIGCSVHPVLLLFRPAQILGDNLLNTVLFMFSWFAIIRTVNWQSPQTICFTRSTLTSVLLVECLPLRELSFSPSQPSLNLLDHSETRVHDIMLTPYTCWSISKARDGVFPKQTKSFSRFIRSSMLIAERPEKEEV